MGFSFRKTLDAGKLGNVNVSKSASTTSVSGKNVRVSQSSNGNINAKITIPGTGITWNKTIKKK